MSIRAYFSRLWAGRVTSSDNIKWFAILWVWFAVLVVGELRRWSPQILGFTLLLCFFASGVPFFSRRVGLLRWWMFACVIPAIIAVIVTQCLRSILRPS
jgi:hypothetical protein